MLAIRFVLSAGFGALLALTPLAGYAQTCSSEFSASNLKALADIMAKDNQSVIPPLHPAIVTLVSRTVKSYACQSIANYYTKKIGLVDDYVSGATYTGPEISGIRFTSKSAEDICGTIIYKTPRGLTQMDATVAKSEIAGNTESSAYLSMVDNAFREYITTSEELGVVVDQMTYPFLPEGRNISPPTAQNVIQIARKFQTEITEKFNKVVEQQKWTSIQVEHFSRVSSCAPVLPVASGPNEMALKSRSAAFETYTEFKALLDEKFK